MWLSISTDVDRFENYMVDISNYMLLKCSKLQRFIGWFLNLKTYVCPPHWYIAMSISVNDIVLLTFGLNVYNLKW